ncbi:unnamed protein product [Caenorhabditis sp. 36 PRJEB53466]|nr:unnamed protein product [Caenorhabditis sp. 36 PRJEB53466]
MFPLFLFFLPLSFSSNERLLPHASLFESTIADDFIRFLKSSENCFDYYVNRISSVEHRNHSKYGTSIQNELFLKYFEMRRADLPEVIVDQLMNSYCRARNDFQIVLNEMKPPAHLHGNYTWNFENLARENIPYNEAKQKEIKRLERFERDKTFYTDQVQESKIGENKVDHSNIKQFYRIAGFLLSVSLSISIQQFVRMYYAGDEGDEDGAAEENMRLELAQIGALFLSVACIMFLLHYEFND